MTNRRSTTPLEASTENAYRAHLGRLESVALRDVWPHEELAFTPWLLANADALADVLEMDLEIEAAEHPVGDFSLDLLGTDLSTGDIVIIENQLELTDHRHLGQLLTYAGGTDAINIVWIARGFRQEHRAALEWLNTRTDPHTRFFGVEVSAVRIGDSLPAPQFSVVVRPNDWGKSIRTQAQARDVGGTQRANLYAEFWDRYLSALADAGLDWARTHKGPPRIWLPTSAGVAGVQFSTTFKHPDGVLISEIWFGHVDADVNTARFQHFFRARADLEAEYGGELVFEPLDHRKGCRISARRPGDVTQTDEWQTYISWFIDSQQRLRDAVAAVGGIPAATARAPQ